MKDIVNKKEIANDLTKIDIRTLKREGFLKAGEATKGTLSWQDGGNKNQIGVTIVLYGANLRFMHLDYTKYLAEEKKEFHYRTEISTTPCHFGGVRYWFHCPLSKDGKTCHRRVAILYQGEDYFACRKCNNLCYQSNLERHTVTSEPKLYEILENTRTHYYKGKMTRRYKSYLKKENATKLYFEAELAKAQKGLARVKRWEACIQKRKRHNVSQ